MRKKLICCLCLAALSILSIVSAATAEDETILEGNTVYELQLVYPIPLTYLSDCGIGMQGKYYLRGNFYLGWYTPVRFIVPGEKKRIDSESTADYDTQVKLMGVAGYTADRAVFACDCSLLAGWRYCYAKTTVHNSAYDINRSHESTSIAFETGVQTTVRWKLGQTFGWQNQFSNLNFDFYAYLPITDDYYESESHSELALGMSYVF